MKTSLTAVLKSFDSPPQIAVEERPIPKPGPGQILLKMLAAPINPADLNILEGKYGDLPKLPATVGNEGAGLVEAIGMGVEGFDTGDMVLPMTRGTWCQHLVVDASAAIRISGDVDPNQAAMLSVNPATALLLLRMMPRSEKGNWVIQNGSNSGVGRSVIQLAKHLGIRTLNVVRRPELIPELQALGADVVVLEEGDIRESVAEYCDGQRPLLALNSVGGSSALNLANALANSGTLVTFGAMGRQPLKIPNGLLIFRDLRFRGFWLSRWLKEATPAEHDALYAELADLVRSGKLIQPVAEKVPLSDVTRGLELAATERRSGKILLDLQSASGD